MAARKPRPLFQLYSMPSAEDVCRDGVLSRKEAARFLGLSLRTVDRLIASKDLPIVRFGDRVMVPKAALVVFLANRLDNF